MIHRRDFLKTTTAAGGALLIGPSGLYGKHSIGVTDYFSVHPFVENNPDAVFIMKTNVDVKTNSAAIKDAGLLFGQSVFTLTTDEKIGVPLSHLFPIKPNLT